MGGALPVFDALVPVTGAILFEAIGDDDEEDKRGVPAGLGGGGVDMLSGV
jgi:hypothetical protein